jgi:hypothetical protein
MQRIDDVDAAQALKLLLQDHRRIRRLLARAQQGSRDVRARAAERACRELEAHAAIEERLLYPLLAVIGGQDRVEAVRAEHDSVRHLVAALQRLDADSAGYLVALRDLAETVDAHVRHEEEALLPRAGGAGLDLAPLGRALLDRQRSGAATDVDVDADRAADLDALASEAADAQQSRTPERRGAH